MNGEQKGDLKNHFLTLFRIIKKKLRRKKEIEKKEKEKNNIRKIQKQKNEQFVFYNINKQLKRTVLVQNLETNNKVKTKKFNKKQDINNMSIKKEAPQYKNVKLQFNTKLKNREKTISKPSVPINYREKKGKKRIEIIAPENKVAKSKNVELEDSILKRINKIILNDKQDLDSLKYKLYEIDKAIYSANDQETLDKLKIQFEIINDKIKKIKRDFEIVKDNLNFENYDELDSYFLLEEIEDFKFINNLESIELLSIKCKQQIEILDDIILVYEQSVNTVKKIDKQEKQVEYFDENTIKINEKVEKLDLITKKINNNLILQNKFIDDMNKKIGESQKNVKISYKYQGLNELINNTLMMGMGVYSYSLTKKPRFRGLKFLIGSFLMYNSIRGMIKFLTPEMKKVTYIYYKDYAKELDSESSRLNFTYNLLNHSIKDIDILKREFKNKFMVYQYQLPEYDIMLEKIDKIQKQLKLQKQELNQIDKNLERQKEKNKEYVKKIEKIEE